MWRNVYYDNSKKKIFLWTWDKNGNRKMYDFDFEPYLYVETNNQSQEDAKSLFNTSLRKITFKKESDRNEYVKTSGIRRVFYNLKAEQQFLLDLYKDKNFDWSQLPFKVFTIDAEVYSPHEFPEASEAKHPINVLTVHDSITDTYNIWGLNPYDKSTINKALGDQNIEHLNINNIHYTYCKTETELLTKFLSFWTKDYPDAVTGWNIEGFDIPYIINRIAYVLDEDSARSLSPVKKLYLKEGISSRFGKEVNKWFIRGVTCLDYMDLYKTFSRGQQDSYSLNNIATVEEIGGKLEFEGELHKLADTNWDHFVHYNIHDVNLVKLLDDKLHFINVARFLAYKGFTKIEDSLGKIMIVTGAMCKEANRMKRIIPTFPPTGADEEYVGGYVRDPQRGFQEAVVSFDANSLYPNTIITLNLSPETKIGKVINRTDEQIEIKFTNGKVHKCPPSQLDEFCARNKIALSAAGVLYRQDVKGICPSFIDSLYQERVSIQNELETLEMTESTPEIKAKILNLDLMQYTIKIFLNSAYGTYANKYSPFYDIDMAASITETGQAVIKEAAKITNNFLNTDPNKQVDYIVAGDTDSIYLTLKDHLNKNKIPLLNEDGTITNECVKETVKLQNYINDNINNWARTVLHSTDPRFLFKRESICDTGLFLEKKRYILSIKYDGKKNKHKFKYVGVEVQRSTYSKPIKQMMKDIITTVFTTKDRLIANQKYQETYEAFKNLDINSIAFRSSIKDYDKYASKSSAFTIAPHTPIHVKSAIYFNHLLTVLNLQSKYPRIVSGTKIKYFYTAQNKYGIKCIGFNEQLPPEFDIAVDLQEMFESLIAPCIERVYNCIGWVLPDMKKQYQSDFLELFGV